MKQRIYKFTNMFLRNDPDFAAWLQTYQFMAEKTRNMILDVYNGSTISDAAVKNRVTNEMISFSWRRYTNIYLDAERYRKRQIEIEKMFSSGVGLDTLSIGCLELSQRAHRALFYYDIKTVQDLLNSSSSALMRIPNFGKTSLTQVKEALSKRGLLWEVSDVAQQPD